MYRLKKKSAFNATYKIRHSYSSGGIVLWVGKKKTSQEYATKVGFVVSKKTHKRSVKRNRLKRLMRESYRLLLKNEEIPYAQNYMSLIFVGHERSLKNDFVETKKNINKLLSNLNFQNAVNK